MEEMFSSLICFYLFFLYISFGTFFGQGIAPASQRGVKQCNQNMESDILRQHSLALSPWPSKNLQTLASDNSNSVELMSYLFFIISYYHSLDQPCFSRLSKRPRVKAGSISAIFWWIAHLNYSKWLSLNWWTCGPEIFTSE